MVGVIKRKGIPSEKNVTNEILEYRMSMVPQVIFLSFGFHIF